MPNACRRLRSAASKPLISTCQLSHDRRTCRHRVSQCRHCVQNQLAHRFERSAYYLCKDGVCDNPADMYRALTEESASAVRALNLIRFQGPVAAARCRPRQCLAHTSLQPPAPLPSRCWSIVHNRPTDPQMGKRLKQALRTGHAVPPRLQPWWPSCSGGLGMDPPCVR